jgi:hypothetical protein
VFSENFTYFLFRCNFSASFHYIELLQVPARGPMIWVILLTILQGICGMAFGLVVSALCDNEQDAIQLALGSFYPNLLLSGIIWPLEGMPEQLRYTGGPHEESSFLFLIYYIKYIMCFQVPELRAAADFCLRGDAWCALAWLGAGVGAGLPRLPRHHCLDHTAPCP